MNSGINARKTMRKRDRNRILSGLAYLCGLPLLIALTFVGSIPFMNGAAFAATKYYGVIICAGLWAVITVVQIIMALVTKNQTARAVVVIFVCVAIMVGGALFFDLSWAKNKVDEAREGYIRDVHGIAADKEVNLADYEDELSKINLLRKYKLQTTYYVPWTSMSGMTDEFNAMIDDFMRVYNVDFKSSVSGDVNTDGSKYGKSQIVRKDKEGKEYTEYWFGETGEVYKENGLYADGYIFSVSVATEILITYYETRAAYEAQGKDADAALEAALVKAANSSAYKEYMKTPEYKAMTSTQIKYMLTETRLNSLVKALAQGLVEENLYGSIDSLVSMLVKDAEGNSVDIKKYIDKKDLNNLTLDKVVGLVQSFGMDLEKDDIMALLGGFSNYEVSNVKPVMYFIEDETLRTYAYAKYFGEIHGGNIGSKLIAGDNGKIGKITMNDSGWSASENAYTLKDGELYVLRATLKFIPTLYPLFAARRYVYVFAGIAALLFAIFYYAQMKVKLIGIKLERMCQIAGGEY